ncbi:hypothetical protein DFH28DRAFT_1036566 [Melampsora americana]|nr:hypothetical protein DFH28DRAFT_1036566 [Melampsora americana]
MSAGFISPNQANADKYFVQITSGPNMGHWGCKICTNRTFKDRVKHSKLTTHIHRVRAELERVSGAQPTVPMPGLAPQSSVSNAQADLLEIFPEDDFVQSRADPIDGSSLPPGLNTAGRDVFDEEMATSDASSDGLLSLYDPDKDLPPSVPSSIDLDEILDGASDAEVVTGPEPENDDTAATDTWLPWYPLRKKEHLAGLLMLGTGRNLMSTAEYKRIRCILKKVMNVDLPDLGHIKKIRTDLKARLGLRILERISPHGNPCFTISIKDVISQELSNPEVVPYLEFLPENDQGVTVDRYSQSKKWREDLPPNLRVPMVDVYGEHFYIYEPAQLEDSRVVVPVFFYKDNSTVRAKCLEVLPGLQGRGDFLIPAEPKFDSELYLDLNVEMFANSFTNIELRDGRKWCESNDTLLLRQST